MFSVVSVCVYVFVCLCVCSGYNFWTPWHWNFIFGTKVFLMLHSHQCACAWKYMHACAHPLGAASNFCECMDKKVQIHAHACWCPRSINHIYVNFEFQGYRVKSYDKKWYLTYFSLLFLCLWLQIIIKVKVKSRPRSNQGHLKIEVLLHTCLAFDSSVFLFLHRLCFR